MPSWVHYVLVKQVEQCGRTNRTRRTCVQNRRLLFSTENCYSTKLHRYSLVYAVRMQQTRKRIECASKWIHMKEEKTNARFTCKSSRPIFFHMDASQSTCDESTCVCDCSIVCSSILIGYYCRCAERTYLVRMNEITNYTIKLGKRRIPWSNPWNSPYCFSANNNSDSLNNDSSTNVRWNDSIWRSTELTAAYSHTHTSVIAT